MSRITGPIPVIDGSWCICKDHRWWMPRWYGYVVYRLRPYPQRGIKTRSFAAYSEKRIRQLINDACDAARKDGKALERGTDPDKIMWQELGG